MRASIECKHSVRSRRIALAVQSVRIAGARIEPNVSEKVTPPVGKPCPEAPATSARKYTKAPKGPLVNGIGLPFWLKVRTESAVALASGVMVTVPLGCDKLGANVESAILRHERVSSTRQTANS